MKYSRNLQSMRGLAAILVFLVHFGLVEAKVTGGAALGGRWSAIGSIAVDLFFVISGFIMVSISRDSFGRDFAAPRFLLARAFRVYPCYWAWSLVVLAVFLVNPAVVNSAQNNRVDLIASFLLLPQPLLPLLSVGWTLIYEMYFYVVFALLIAWCPRERLAAALSCWSLAVVVGGFATSGLGLAWVDVATHPMTLEFIGGCFAAMLMPALPRKLGFATLVAGFAWLGVAIARTSMALPAIFADPWARVAVNAVPCVLFVLGAVTIERDGPASTIEAALNWIGDRSYSFYLSHLLVLSVVGRAWSRWGPAGIEGNLLALIGSFLLCMLVASASYRLVELRAMRLSKLALSRLRPASGAGVRVDRMRSP